MLLFGEIENVLDELYNINYPWPAIDFEDLNALGLLLVGLGLFVYTNLLHRIRLRTEQSKRETELYATLLRHDLRNDLQAVMGYIEMAESDENPKALLESAKMATLRMSRLVKTFSLDIESQDDELIPLIVQTARDAEKTHSGLKIKLSIDANASNTRAYGLSLIQIALENIFRNSSQYCGKNPIVDVNVRKVGGLIEILVSDNGPGIPEELRKRIFSRGISTNEGGLGLYLASTILKGCGGSIELLDSQKGTQFKLLIPIKQ
jgi:signal transduction histidine kinase